MIVHLDLFGALFAWVYHLLMLQLPVILPYFPGLILIAFFMAKFYVEQYAFLKFTNGHSCFYLCVFISDIVLCINIGAVRNL